MSARDEVAYDRMEERLADIIGGYLRRAGVAVREHDDLACANHLLAEAKKEPLASRLALARALVPEMAVVPREATEVMQKAGGHINSEWLNDNAPIGEARYAMPMESVWTAMLTAAEKEPGHGS